MQPWLSNTAKLSDFTLVFVLIFRYGHELSVMNNTEPSRYKWQRCDVCDKTRSCEIRKGLWAELLFFRIVRTQQRWFGYVTRICHKEYWRVLQAQSMGKRPGGRRRSRCRGWNLRHSFVPSWYGTSRTIKGCWKPWGTVFRDLHHPRNPPQRKSRCASEWKMNQYSLTKISMKWNFYIRKLVFSNHTSVNRLFKQKNLITFKNRCVSFSGAILVDKKTTLADDFFSLTDAAV